MGYNRLMKRALILSTVLTLGLIFILSRPASACTGAMVSANGSASGRAILWKNRDTDYFSNKVVYVTDQPFSYIALVNAHAPDGRHAFAGLNAAGFGIINTVAYNLPLHQNEMQDLEGIVMGDALRTCRTVMDFSAYLETRQGPDLGSQATFGVMDAAGRAWLFEVHNHGYTVHDADKEARDYLVVTNFARSGPKNKGAGYLRFARATELFNTFPKGQVDFETILTRFTRDTGHTLPHHPDPDTWKRSPKDSPNWIYASDCISRPYTSAAVVMVGKDPDDPKSVATLWAIPGQPMCAAALPLWVESGEVPEDLWKGKDALLWQQSLALKARLFPLRGGNRHEYMNLTILDNAAGTGILPPILKQEQAILKETRIFLSQPHTPAELAAFQRRISTIDSPTTASPSPQGRP